MLNLERTCTSSKNQLQIVFKNEAIYQCYQIGHRQHSTGNCQFAYGWRSELQLPFMDSFRNPGNSARFPCTRINLASNFSDQVHTHTRRMYRRLVWPYIINVPSLTHHPLNSFHSQCVIFTLNVSSKSTVSDKKKPSSHKPSLQSAPA